MRYAFIKQHAEIFCIGIMCRLFAVRRSGYYAWQKRGESRRAQANRVLTVKLRAVFAETKQRYGSPRITAELTDQGERCSENRVARLMRQSGLRARSKRKFIVTTKSKIGQRVHDNLLERRFTVEKPNDVWVSDLSFIWTHEGWLYLAVVLDLFARRIVGWAIGARMTKAFVIDAVMMALSRRNPKNLRLFHSDRGSQYAADEVEALFQHKGITPSMSRKGNCWDNAVNESFFATLKTELDMKAIARASRNEARAQLIEYIECFYNATRRHSTLGKISPAEFERRYWGSTQQSTPDRKIDPSACYAFQFSKSVLKNVSSGAAALSRVLPAVQPKLRSSTVEERWGY